MNKIDELEINSEESRKKFDESLSNLLDQLNVNDKELVTELFITVLGKGIKERTFPVSLP